MRRFAVVVAVVLAATLVPAVLSPAPALAAAPNAVQRIADINPGASPSSPQFLTRFGDIAVFQADDGTHGVELWSTDGTSAGTELVKDINPGSGGSDPKNFTVFGGIVLFTANDGTSGVELWKTDGTAAGTTRVADVNPGSGDGFVGFNTDPRFTVFGSMVLFDGYNPAHGTELWHTDGTTGGTGIVTDIGAVTTNSGLPDHLTVFGSVVLFAATDDSDGFELWKTDGTASGTAPVANINPSTGSDPADITAFGSIALFTADDGSGRELWKTDGTSGGTTMVKDIEPSGSSDPADLTVFGGIVLFQANQSATGQELWKTNGTMTGTVLVDDIQTDPNSGSNPTSFHVLGSRALFVAADNSSGYEPWSTDGTTSGTARVKDICTGLSSSLQNPMTYTTLGTVALFAADDCNNGTELWATDGTASGTKQVADINPGGSGSDPQSIIDFGTMALFAADDGTHGLELYRTVRNHVPGAPTIGTATAGNAQATVSFTPPTSNGGSPITSYTVTSTPGGITKTGTASPITVTGLTNGVSYRFSVHATNAVGDGPESALSNAVTPTATTSKTITVVQPNGGEHIARGSTYTIKWSYTGNPGTTVKIVLLKAGTAVQTIASSQSIGTGGAGQRAWTPSTSLAAASTYKIRIVVNASSPVVSDTSNNTFSLT